MKLDWTDTVTISTHAEERITTYLGRVDLELVRGEIRSAILADRVADHQPNWTRGCNSPGEQNPTARYLWNPDATRCWVVVKNSARVIVVKTVLLAEDVEAARGESHHVRTGMART